MRLLLLLALFGALGATGARGDMSPRTLYALNCAGCHQMHGEGHGSIPQLQGFVGNFLQVPGGRAFLVRVPGVAQSSLSNADIAAVLNWMLLEFSRDQLPNGFQPYSESEVAEYRGGRLVDIVPVRAKLLDEMRARQIIE